MNKQQRLSVFKITSTILLLVTFVFFRPTNSLAQKEYSFSGMLEYKISVRDTALRSLFPDNSMFIYTNDTILRVENFTNQLGKQVVIRHIEMQRSYLLLDTPIGKYKIRTDETASDSLKSASQFTFKQKLFKTRIVGRKANRMLVSHADFETPIEFLYFKKVPAKYSTFFKEMPGLPVRFSVPTADGIIDYELVKMNEYTPNRDLFGVPVDFQLVTFGNGYPGYVSLQGRPGNRQFYRGDEQTGSDR